ncbi:MAG: hypothetical protein H6712_01190 [Myxococcales bacterium]|nr:hypothetical protein [Myxococcales bacterium]MCB9712439.1 hypothetical protein [Myxococcales bacterium]
MGAGLGAWLLSACPSSGFLCQSDDQCIDGDREGVCTSDGRCAFSDEDCASGLAYGELAGPDLAGSCVPVDDASSTATDDGPVPSSDGASADETSAPACSPGSTCQPDDPCATAGLCNDAGSCVVTETIACDDPPSPCHGPGQCEPGGTGCSYPPRPPDAPCEDGDPCTTGTRCDETGTCSGGEVCKTDDPCQVAQCTPEGCVIEALDDGHSCGDPASMRCCSGQCVDISSDEEHCGGCSSPCAAGQPCQSVAATPLCALHPADTSGRCVCSNSTQCPLGQQCGSGFPYSDVCAPQDPDQCDGLVVDLGLCPSYCGY